MPAAKPPSRRQQVTPEQPTRDVGSWFQVIPVLSTKTIPASAARSSIGRRPGCGSGVASAAGAVARSAPTARLARAPQSPTTASAAPTGSRSRRAELILEQSLKSCTSPVGERLSGLKMRRGRPLTS
jgi:hypothetical protein